MQHFPLVSRFHPRKALTDTVLHWKAVGMELEVAWLTMASGTMPARSSCASWISVSASCVAVRLGGYSTCQAIQRLPSGSGKISIFRSTWSTLWTPVSYLPQSRKQKERQRTIKQTDGGTESRKKMGCRRVCARSTYGLLKWRKNGKSGCIWGGNLTF